MTTATNNVRRSVSVASTSTAAISTTLAKMHLEIPLNDNARDDLIAAQVAAATGRVEKDLQQLLITRAVTETFDQWPSCGEIEFYWGPAVAITSLKYYDATNTQQTISSSNYSINLWERKLIFGSTYSFPIVYDRHDAIELIYTAGYGTTATAMPANLVHMLRLRIGFDFENRDMLQNDQIYTERAYQALVMQNKRSSYP